MNLLHNIIRPFKSDLSKFPNLKINGIKTDSNKVTKGDLFIAIKGNKIDGHKFIHQAVNLGASALITNNDSDDSLSLPQIKVKDTRIATSLIAANYYNNPSRELTVIGITGTNGKTSTACLITSILKESGLKVAQIGTLGVMAEEIKNEKGLTTPDPISLHKTFSALKQKRYSHIVMEVSSHALDQHRVADIDFNIAIFTNLSQEHLDYHKSMNSYYLAKLKLFKMLTAEAISIVNNSSKYAQEIIGISKCKTIAFSSKSNGDIFFDNPSITLSGITGDIKAENTNYRIKSKLLGDFNSENILAAVSAGHALKIKKEKIELGIQSCHTIPGRMESFDLKSGARAIIDYAHTPDAYQKVLIMLKKTATKKSRIYVVFGAGGERDRSKRPEMARISEKFAKHTFIVPDNPRTEDPKKIIKDILSGFSYNNYSLFNDRRKGLEEAIINSKKNDIIVIFGKGREEYQDVGNGRIYYSDLKVIQDYQ